METAALRFFSVFWTEHIRSMNLQHCSRTFYTLTLNKNQVHSCVWMIHFCLNNIIFTLLKFVFRVFLPYIQICWIKLISTLLLVFLLIRSHTPWVELVAPPFGHGQQKMAALVSTYFSFTFWEWEAAAIWLLLNFNPVAVCLPWWDMARVMLWNFVDVLKL